jgi:DNA-binding SARP family transcriptional activator
LLKARALVKLLALAPRHRLGHDEVLERLWRESEPKAALNNFYYALHATQRLCADILAGRVAADELVTPLVGSRSKRVTSVVG